MRRAQLARIDAGLTFHEPAAETVVADVERRLRARLPQQLRELLLETDGVQGAYGLGLVWPLGRIASDQPFDDLVCFADAGNGDRFAFALTAGAIDGPDVMVWDHEDDSRTRVASDFDGYLRGWLSGELTI
jgi:hypothetical protein